MKRHLTIAMALCAASWLAPVYTSAQAPAAPKSAKADTAGAPSAQESEAIDKRLEAYLRAEYAWGPGYKLKMGPLTAAPAGNLYQVSVEVSAQDGSDSATIYVTKDGHYMFRGDISDLTKDELAETRSQIHLDNYASKGPADAKVVIVEFGDFECPVCRQLDSLLRAELPEYPQVRFVFKDLPLVTIHPWAMTAALAGRCALHQSQDVFWKLHDAIYDSQDLISPENAYNKLAELAQQAGVNPDAFKACMADPKTADAVHASMDEAKSLGVTSTPTSFIDGRRMVGPDPTLLKQYLDYDLSLVSPPK